MHRHNITDSEAGLCVYVGECREGECQYIMRSIRVIILRHYVKCSPSGRHCRAPILAYVGELPMAQRSHAQRLTGADPAANGVHRHSWAPILVDPRSAGRSSPAMGYTAHVR